MKLVKQGEAECALATIAMLAGKEIHEARQVAAKLMGMDLTEFKWHDSLIKNWKKSKSDLYHYIDSVCIELGIQPIHIVLPDIIPSASEMSNELDLKGKGHLVLILTNGEGHSIAFENGLVYDANMDKPRTWQKYLEFRNDRYYLQIKKIYIEKIEEEKS